MYLKHSSVEELTSKRPGTSAEIHQIITTIPDTGYYNQISFL